MKLAYRNQRENFSFEWQHTPSGEAVYKAHPYVTRCTHFCFGLRAGGAADGGRITTPAPVSIAV